MQEDALMRENSLRERRSWLMAICLLAATAGVLKAEESAIIRDRGFAAGGGKEVDAAVRIVTIDSVPVDAKLSQSRVPAGTHVIEVSCTARVFVGMGTVDFPNKSALTIRVESGRVYRLDAKVTVQGDCSPVLE
jgi:hypothetical protein